MQEKFIQEVAEFVVGKPGQDIAKLLFSKKHVNEFIVAKKMDLTINQTRNLLYKLSDQGLVSHIRKKDKKKGWYTYFWKIEVLKSLLFLEKILEQKINQLKGQIKSRETKVFYVCERCNIEFTEENALIHNFTCDECGGIFTLKDNSKILKELHREVGKMESELTLVREELVKERSTLEKLKEKEFSRIKKEKAAERAKKKNIRDKEKAKNSPKKKAAKKKSVKGSKKVTKKKSSKKPIKKKSAKKVSKKKTVKSSKKVSKKKKK